LPRRGLAPCPLLPPGTAGVAAHSAGVVLSTDRRAEVRRHQSARCGFSSSCLRPSGTWLK